MHGLHLYTGNRLERLADLMAAVVRTPLPSPLDPEIVVVRSKGMERWVTLELARRLGTWMNGRFPFPNAFVDEAFSAALGDAPSDPGLAREVLPWRLLAALPRGLDRPEFEPLRAYLGDEPRSLKRWQLVDQLADLFDQYTLFRPDLITEWDRGRVAADPHARWQAALWRELASPGGAAHRAERRRAFLDRLRRRPAPEFPWRRVCVFGIPALPPFHLDVLAALAEHVEVHFFLLSPCREYWGDLEPGRPAAEGRGNALLASLGRAGRDFHSALLDGGYEFSETEAYEDPEGTTLLARLQADVLHLREPTALASCAAAPDDSIRVHSCHGPLREVEVLRDVLLDRFEREPDLEPRHVVVMTPDIEAYAPLVRAVFDAPGAAEQRIPFTVADRSARTGSGLAAAFLDLLSLAGGRYPAPRVLDVLECAAVRRRFGFTEADRERVRGWVRDTRIRWGVDASHREALDLPGFAENTWRAGLDRLLLGYALPAGEGRLFGGVAPFDGVEGQEAAAALGRLAEFTERLFGGLDALGRPRDPDAWSDSLGELFDRLFLPDEEEEREARPLRRALAGLAETARRGGFAGEVDLEVVRTWLGQTLAEAPFGGGFLSGGVTFCAMLPMRSVPFPVVCLLGLNDGAYPRASASRGFDLMAAAPRRGDRSLRHEDRYVFLEALLSARRHLHLSYVGQSPADGAELPPSVLVSELADFLERAYGVSVGELTVRHRLQAFSPAYYEGSGPLFSYFAEGAAAAQCLTSPRRAPPPPFLAEPLPELPAELRRVELRALSAFFANPCRALLSRRLGVRLGAEEREAEDREPFDLKGLERYALAERLVESALAGRPADEAFALARAEGLLPHGTVGDGDFHGLAREATHFADAVRPRLAGGRLEPVSFDAELDGFRLYGRVEALWARGLVHYRPAKAKAGDWLRLWLEQLGLGLAPTGGAPRDAHLVAADGVWRLRAPADAPALLSSLLSVYGQGLREPLPFFLRTSWAYACGLRARGGGRARGLAEARRAWEPDRRYPGEGQEPHIARCFPMLPLGAGFEELAERVWGPLLDHREESAR